MSAAPVKSQNQEEYQQYFFSPSFQCYTSPLFYRSLLLELEWVASVIDECKEQAREIVWNQLFILAGGPKTLTSKKLISPTIANWSKSTTMNLLAIELLYLAFAVALNKFPDFIKNNLSDKHLLELSDNLAPSRAELIPHPQQKPNTIPVLKHSCPVPTDRTLIDRVASNDRPPLHHPSLSIENTSTKVESSNTEDTAYVAIFKKLIDLQSWKEILDNQPSDMKRRIWDALHSLEQISPSVVDYNSFSNTINLWAQDIVPNMKLILRLHSTISSLIPNELNRISTPPQTNVSKSSVDYQSFNFARSSDTFCTPESTNHKPSPFGMKSSSTLPRISSLINGVKSESSSNSPERIYIAPIVGNPPPRHLQNTNPSNDYNSSFNKFPNTSRQLPPLQSPFGGNTPAPFSGAQKRKEHIYEEPQTKRMKLDFLNNS